MIVCHSRPGFGTRRRIGGKSKGLPGREERRKAKRLFFDTTEATNLLKIKDRVFEKGKNELVFKRQLAPKCTPQSPFLPIPDPIFAWPGPNYRGLHGVSSFLGYAGVRFVATDFQEEALGPLLRSAGFEPTQPAFWLWEGVTMYLQAASNTRLAAPAPINKGEALGSTP